MEERPVAMISSSSLDLSAHRHGAEEACKRLDFRASMMEYEAAADRVALRFSLDVVDECDVYVLILGFRYGTVPAGEERSYTHLEYERAKASGKAIVALLMDEDHPVIRKDVESGVGGDKLAVFREAVAAERVVKYFSSPDDMRVKLTTELAVLQKRLGRTSPPAAKGWREPAPPEPLRAQPYSLLGADELVGRREEFARLQAWIDDPGSDLAGSDLAGSGLVVLMAIGGMGKSALAWKWFAELRPARESVGRVWWSFYEEDAHFDAFVLRTLAYLSRTPVAELASVPVPERVDRLTGLLEREDHVLVLDGFERLLLAYSRPDANQVEDGAVARAAAESRRGSRNVRNGIGAHTGSERLRSTTDPRVGTFLRRLARSCSSRVLVTSRLFPSDLQQLSGAPLGGVGVVELGGLAAADALTLWTEAGCSGEPEELVDLFRSLGNYPLLIRALAAEVAGFRPAPGDYSTWCRAHPEFDPFRSDLLTPDDRRSHVLKYALDGLTDLDRQVLQTISAVTGPVTYPTLATVLLAPAGPVSDDARLDAVLAGLEDRGLLGWDRGTNRYELHPVVRGVALAGLDEDAQQEIYGRLAAHFGSLPETDLTTASSLDDLANPLRLTGLHLKLGNYVRVVGYAFPLIAPLVRIGAFDTLIELFERLERDPRWHPFMESEGIDAHGFAFSRLMACFQAHLGGQTERALDLLGEPEDWADIANFRVVVGAARVRILTAQGRLARAEQLSRRGLDVGRGGRVSTVALGALLALIGEVDEARRWLRHHAPELDGDPTDHYYELGWDALRHGDPDTAVACAEQMYRASSSIPYQMAAALTLYGSAQRWFDEQKAEQFLVEALAAARSARHVGDEVTARIELARLLVARGRLDEAVVHAWDAVALSERCQFRLRFAEAQVVLGAAWRAAGHQESAVEAARAAFRAAWCDGGRHVYRHAMDEARAMLVELGADLPQDVPVTAPPPVPVTTATPTSLAEHLRELVTHDVVDENELRDATARVRYAPPDPELERSLVGLTTSSRAAERAAAFSALPELLPGPTAPGDLGRAAAMDPEPSVRASAVPLLRDAGDRAAIEELLRVDDNADVQYAALTELVRTDPAALSLVDVVEHGWVRADALLTAAAHPDESVSVILLDRLRTDPDPLVTVASAVSLRRRSEGRVDELWDAVRGSDDPSVRGSLLLAVAGGDLRLCVNWMPALRSADIRGSCADVATRALLVERFEQDVRAVRVLAAVLLGDAGRPLLRTELAGSLDSEDIDLVVAGLHLLGELGEVESETLVALLERPVAADVASVVMLQLAGRPETVPVVRRELSSTDADRRRGAVEALARSRDAVDQRLLSANLDAAAPFLDPEHDVVDDARVAAAAEALDLDRREVERRYAEVADIPFRRSPITEEP